MAAAIVGRRRPADDHLRGRRACRDAGRRRWRVGAVGVTELDAADAGPLPWALDACTVNVYAVPAVSPVTVALVAGGVPVMVVGVWAVDADVWGDRVLGDAATAGGRPADRGRRVAGRRRHAGHLAGRCGLEEHVDPVVVRVVRACSGNCCVRAVVVDAVGAHAVGDGVQRRVVDRGVQPRRRVRVVAARIEVAGDVGRALCDADGVGEQDRLPARRRLVGERGRGQQRAGEPSTGCRCGSPVLVAAL